MPAVRAQNTLRERERRFRELLDALPAAIYTTDAEGRLTYYNTAAAELWGQQPTLGFSEWCGSWRLFWPDGTPMRHDECPMAIALKEDRAGARLRSFGGTARRHARAVHPLSDAAAR
ncbi:MAG: PAS domain-containing protein [Pseudolabrys sp.]